MATRELLGLIPPGPSDLEDPSFGVAVDCIPPRLSVVGDPSRASYVLNPSFGLTDGVLLGRGLPFHGSLVDVERELMIDGGTKWRN